MTVLLQAFIAIFAQLWQLGLVLGLVATAMYGVAVWWIERRDTRGPQ